MKFMFLLAFFGMFTLSAKVYSQDQAITIRIQNATLHDLFKNIEKQSAYRFFYNDELVGINKTVSIDVSNMPIDAILGQLLENTGLKYRRMDNNLIVVSSLALLQQSTVSGTVKDAAGDPLPGVNVTVKGTITGVVTDINGKYAITVPNKSSELVFSFVGYVTNELVVGDQNVIDVTMNEDMKELEEVVVVGYGTAKRSDIIGSISTVKSREIVQAPVSNLSQSLSGRLPGLVTRQTSGEPGNDNATLSIRGFDAALVIVDGVESSLNLLDPNEIETISILKDASAAIYGARAGNGVILVTTKRGILSKPTINFNYTYSFQTVTSYPKPLDAGRWAEIIRESEVNSGMPEESIRFSEEDVRKWKEGKEPGYTTNTNWWDAIMNSYSPLRQANVSMSGGSDNIKYYTFLGYTGQAGMYKSGDNRLNRYNIRSNIDGKINHNLSAGFDLSLVISDLTSPRREQSSLWQDFYESQPIYPATLPDPNKVPYTGGITSIVADTYSKFGGYRDKNINQFFSTIYLKYLIPGIDGLSVKGLVNYSRNIEENKYWQKYYSMWTYDAASGNYMEKAGPVSTTLSETNSSSNLITGQIFLNYDRVFLEKHNLSVLLLTELSNYNDKWIGAGRSGYITDAIDYLFAGGADSQTADGRASESGRVSYVARINYAFLNKYYLETTMRYDGSPKFPSGTRWGFFPSVSAGWRISEESFLKDQTQWLNNLKIRASFSNTGYDAIGAFQYLSGYTYANRYIVNDEVRNGLISTGLSNPNITWENMTVYNAGLDFSTFGGKLYGEFDAFYRKRGDILATRLLSLPNTFGATLPAENINSMNNRGFELMAGHQNKKGDFGYNISANISWTRAKWDHYEEPDYTDPDDIRIKKVSGNWANRWFGYRTDGLFTSQQEIDNHKLDQDKQGNATIRIGDVKYIDHDNNNTLDWKDQVEIGRSNTPEIMFGLNLGLEYRNFDFSALFQGATRCNVIVNLQMANEGNVPESLYQLRWTEQNNDKNALVPRTYMGGNTNNQYASDYWLKDAGYMRLKALSLGYTLPKHWLEKLSISHLRIYFSGTNLLTVSGLSKFNMDPEAPNGVRAGYSYPQQKTFSLGLNLSF